ncbi:MAG: B12-binding domain-containing radical SAM protein, partial [Nitrospinae bacterium]|nr:B12-binding domain-containing radical SAM protein [Nitrospinota bacterium]
MKINKIALVQPNLKWVDWNFKTLWEIHPINLCLIGAMIEKDYEVTIIDANIDNLSQGDFQEKISSLKPDLVGITLLTMEYGEAAHIASRLVKQANPETVTVLGGIYASQASELAGKDVNVDYMVLGEGEHTFPKLLKYLEGKGDLPQMGIGYWKEGKRVVQGKSPFIMDLDALPFPAYHLVDYSRYAHTLQRISVDSPRELPYARVFTSRGCGVGCTFCEIESISGAKFRHRSPKNVVAELVFLKATYGIRSLIFDDDNFYINKNRSKAIFKGMIDAKLDLKWNAIAVPVFYLNDELLEVMRESGCHYVDMAIESGVERVLCDIVHKPVKLAHVVNMVRKAKSLGIDVNAHFILGFPGETWDEIRATVKFAENLGTDYTKFFIAQPLPGTRMYDMVMEHNELQTGVNMKTDLDWSSSRIVSAEFTSKDLSVLRAYEWDRLNF